MNPEQAIEILIQVAAAAQKGGVLNLEEAAVVAQAVRTLAPKKEEQNNQGPTNQAPPQEPKLVEEEKDFSPV